MTAAPRATGRMTMAGGRNHADASFRFHGSDGSVESLRLTQVRMKLSGILSTMPIRRMTIMKSAQALIKTFLILGPMVVALLASGSISSYADVTTPGSSCSPFYKDPSCADISPTVVIDRWTDWRPHSNVKSDESHRNVDGGYSRGHGSDLGDIVPPPAGIGDNGIGGDGR